MSCIYDKLTQTFPKQHQLDVFLTCQVHLNSLISYSYIIPKEN